MNSLMLAASEARKRFGKRAIPFLGEVASADFITGNALAAAIGLGGGTAMNVNGGWLKFHDPVDNKVKYISKMPIRRNISWNRLNELGAVSGSKEIVISGKTYKVRLINGLREGGSGGANTYDSFVTHTSEWNRLMYHVSGKPFARAQTTLASEGIEEGDWAQYTETELGLAAYNGVGTSTLCRESSIPYRGKYGVSYLNYSAAAASDDFLGWRPLLELVE